MWFALFVALVLGPWVWSATKALGVLCILVFLVIWRAELGFLCVAKPRRITPLSSVPLRPLDTGMPESAPEELELLARLITRDFVSSWHEKVVQEEKGTDSETFPTAIASLLGATLHRLVQKTRRIDTTELIMQRIIPILREHMVRYGDAEIAMYGATKSVPSDTGFDELFLATRYNRGQLHSAVGNVASMDTRESERAYLRVTCTRILDACLPQDSRLGRASKTFVREILACAILCPLIQLISEPDWINLLLCRRAAATIEQRERVERLRSALDDGRAFDQLLHRKSASQLSKQHVSPRKLRRRKHRGDRAKKSSKHRSEKFDEFLKQITSTKSMMEARQIRNSIVLQIQKVQKEEDTVTNVGGSMVGDEPATPSYMSMLRHALVVVDEHLAVLSEAQPRSSPLPMPKSPDNFRRATNTELRDILSNPSSLSFFMEYMERRDRAILVYFWVTVNAFKNPLEEADLEKAEQICPAALVAQRRTEHSGTECMEEARSVQETMRILLDHFYDSPLLEVRSKYIATARHFVDQMSAEDVCEEQIYVVRQSALLAQHDVMHIMLENDWEPFAKSNLYFQAEEQLANNSAFEILPNQEMEPELAPGVASSNASTGSCESPTPRSHAMNACRVHLDKDDRIPLRYGFLVGPGDGTRNTDLFSERRPLFGQDPLFGEDDDDSEWISDNSGEPATPRQTDALSINEELNTVPAEQFEGESKQAMPDNEVIEATMRDDRYRSANRRLKELVVMVEKLRKHEAILDTLLKKAELSGTKANQVRLIEASSCSVQRDLRSVLWEMEYVEQIRRESMHVFDGSRGEARVSIHDTEIHLDGDQRPFILYHICVHLPSSSAASSTEGQEWMVSRRYSEFRTLHQNLKRKFRSVWPFESMFPGKKLVGSMNEAFVEQRRAALERYLQAVVALSEVRLNADMREFLSDTGIAEEDSRNMNDLGPTLITRMFDSVAGFADNVDDLVGGFRPPMFDAVVQQLIKGDSQVDIHASAPLVAGVSEDPSRPSYITEPLCDFIIELFQLRHKADWLRRRAIVIILQNLLGSTIETWMRGMMSKFLSETVIYSSLASLRQMLWPDNAHFQLNPPPVRSATERLDTLNLTHATMATLVPAVMDNILGNNRAQIAAQKMVAMVQNQRLNKHVLYTILDELVNDMLREDL